MRKNVLKYLFDYLLGLCMYIRVCIHVFVLRFSSRMYCLFAERTYVRTCTQEKGIWQDLCHSIRMHCMCCISRMRAVYIQYCMCCISRMRAVYIQYCMCCISRMRAVYIQYCMCCISRMRAVYIQYCMCCISRMRAVYIQYCMCCISRMRAVYIQYVCTRYT